MTWSIFMQSLGLVLDPYVLLVIFCSALFGLFVGCIPRSEEHTSELQSH